MRQKKKAKRPTPQLVKMTDEELKAKLELNLPSEDQNLDDSTYTYYTERTDLNDTSVIFENASPVRTRQEKLPAS